VRKFEAAHFAGDGAGESSFLVPEELALEQTGGNCSAVNLDEGAILPVTEAVDGTRKKLFAGTSLALDENGCVGGRHGLDLLEHLAQAATLTNDVFKAVLEIDFLLEVLLFLAQPVTQLGNPAEGDRVVHRHRNLGRNPHQSIGLLLSNCALHPAHDRQRSDGLTVVDERDPAARLHAELGEAQDRLWGMRDIRQALDQQRFARAKCQSRKRVCQREP
jgi:hypothetical protein